MRHAFSPTSPPSYMMKYIVGTCGLLNHGLIHHDILTMMPFVAL